jgi:hypothetical protein
MAAGFRAMDEHAEEDDGCAWCQLEVPTSSQMRLQSHLLGHLPSVAISYHRREADEEPPFCDMMDVLSRAEIGQLSHLGLCHCHVASRCGKWVGKNVESGWGNG